MHGNAIWLLAAILLLTAYSAFAVDPPAVQWTVTDTGIGDAEADWVEQTADHGFIVGGWTALRSVQSDFYMVKTDSAGEVAWRRRWGPASEQDEVRSVRQTLDGGYILAGYTGQGGTRQPYVAKTDAAGTILWDTILSCEAFAEAFCVQQTRDSGYVVAVLYAGFGDSAGVHVVKLDTLGNTQWRTVLRNGGTECASGIPVLQTSDGGYLVGASKRAGLDMELWLVRISSGGDSLWAKTYPTQNLGEAVSVCQTSDGGYVLTGGGAMEGDPDDPCAIYLAKTNSSGVLQWKKTYGGPDMDMAFSVRQTSDGGFVLAGSSVRPDSNYNAVVIKTTSTGAVSWTEYWAYSSTGGTGAAGIRQTFDGGYIVTGGGVDDIPETGGFIFLVKLAPARKR